MTIAVIFDMNGVILDDEQIMEDSWLELSKNHGLKLTGEEYRANLPGKKAREIFEYIFKRKLTDEEFAKYSDEGRQIVGRIFEERNLPLNPGLEEFLDSLAEQEIPIALASGARRWYFEMLAKKFGLDKYFSVVITGEDVVKGKPDPEAFLKAASKLGVEPSVCVVFEDGLNGIKAARAAKMKVIGITTTWSKRELYEAGADRVIDSFFEITVDELLD